MAGLKIGFMGTPGFALKALQALKETAHEIVVVYSQPPRPKGRGQKIQPSPVHIFAQENHIPVFTPKSLKSQEAQNIFSGHKLDVAVVAAYGLLLPPEILQAPLHGCLNIHGSLLPRWRGASPIQQAIWRGDKQTGISIMQMDVGLDTGPVISAQSIDITPQTTSSILHDELADLGARMIVQTLDQLVRDGFLKSDPQDDAKATYAPLLKKEDGRIDWAQDAVSIDRQIRALNPWPGVFTQTFERRLKILSAKIMSGEAQMAGTIINREGDVACGLKTILRLEKIQPEGSKPMDFGAALNGGYIKIGERFL